MPAVRRALAPPLPRHPAARSGAALAALAAFAALALGACASLEQSAMQRMLDSWQSAPIEQAKEQWGPPQSVQAVPGGTAYLWTEEVPPPHPPGSGPRDARVPASPEPVPRPGQCQRRLIAGPNGLVIGGDWSGNACCLTAAIGRCAELARKSAGT
ncbi:hypothetical protein [Cupriavidus sp. WS]|uniref:hypothetical protein n=1 Tax=Cupriavidus sp. WS TaxID=1312922 RepID=UPI0003A0C432|nr:hypothetical protein [Cupriavidus sp. WS]